LGRLRERLRLLLSGHEGLITEMLLAVKHQGADFERSVDDAIRRVAGIVAEPLRAEIASLRVRVEQAAERLDRLAAHERSRPAPGHQAEQRVEESR